MPNQPSISIENNFTKGLVTEFTGLNFPENGCTDCDNVTFSVIGDAYRRLGIDYEVNHTDIVLDRAGRAIATYKWNNAGGDGVTQIVAVQIGGSLLFYKSSDATTSSPISAQLIVGQTQDISGFVANGGSFTISKECTFADGNGYLFVYHPDCDPFYCTYSAGTITVNVINLQIRDFAGVPELGVADNTRPSALTASHNYNLINQGWTSGNPWTATSSSSVSFGTGAKVFTVASGLTITPGQSVLVSDTNTTSKGGLGTGYMAGTVTSYSVTTLTLSISSSNVGNTAANPNNGWSIVPISTGYLSTWLSAVGNYPSNADQWWNFKNASDVFDPATTQANVSVGAGAAPKGHILLNAFTQYRTSLSGVSGVTDITTTSRPSNGAWFQGRVWYTGVNSSMAASGTAPYTTWTENIYFSQVVEGVSAFEKCYQTNDPTSELLFDLLPTDGGIIVIQGSGPIYKLFPIQNGMLIFAANGVWFLTGSQGIGFSANDYTITKISSTRSLSNTSFVDVLGLPYFWNEDGVYSVQPTQGGGLSVQSLSFNTIDSFYNTIPLSSKVYARGAYDPINYTIQWIYKSTEASDVSDRYEFDKILNYVTLNKAFYPYTVEEVSTINSICYVTYPGGSGTPAPAFKYLATNLLALSVSFADENDTDYVDWGTTDYESYFITGYKLHGKGQTRFQMPYIYMYSNTETPVSYKIQGLWDYASSGNSGRWSTAQIVNIDEDNYSMVFKRHRIRGQGLVLQIKVKSVSGEPFDIMGWSAAETVNTAP